MLIAGLDMKCGFYGVEMFAENKEYCGRKRLMQSCRGPRSIKYTGVGRPAGRIKADSHSLSLNLGPTHL